MRRLICCIGKYSLALWAIMAFFVLNQPLALAQLPDSLLYRQLPNYPFVFVSDSSVTTPPVITDSVFDAVARGIRFRVNRTELLADDPFIALYNDSLVPWLQQRKLVLQGVFVKGAASPEGPYDNNVRLSRERTARLVEFLGSRLGQSVTDQLRNAQCITEDYAYLVKLMEQANDPETAEVKRLWEDCQGDERLCKARLMALNEGRTWERLLRMYFPTLRQSRVVLWFVLNPSYIPASTHRATALPLPKATEALARSLALPLPALNPGTDQPVRRAYSRRHLIAARTNLIHDLLYVPQFGFAPGGNLQLEYYPLDGHYTYNAGFTFHNHRHWNNHKFFQTRDVQLEVRRYFRGQGAFIGPYLGAYAEGAVYGIGFSETKGWEGEGGGAGLSGGYTCKLNKKGSLRLEFSLSVGAFVTRYDPYVWGNPINGTIDGLYYYDYHGNASLFKKRNHRFTWLGPTNAGIHITYDIIYRKKKEIAE